MNNRAISNLTLQLQKSLDSNYDVINMETVLYVIQQLENTTITKEQLETTRLAKYINELRRRTSCERLARRAKNLLKKWRDIFMPAIQQQSAATAATPAAGTGATVSATVPGHSTRSQSRQQQQSASQQIQASQQHAVGPIGGSGGGVASNFPANISSITKVSTGSANNNNSSRNSNSSLSNGGFSQQQQHQQQQLPQGASKVDAMKLRGSRTVSPASDRKQPTYPPHNAPQPTSFANVLSTQHLIQHTFPSASSSSTASAFNHDRTGSPVPAQPASQQRRRQSPVPPLDFDVSQLRAHATSSKSKNVANGENSSVAGMPSVMDDFRDSNSLMADIAASADDIQSNQELISFASCAPNLNVGDISSPASGHRKSKKHKKEKKRNKQSPDKPYSTSEAGLIAAQQKMSVNSQGLTSFLNLYGEDIRPGGEDELHNVATTGGTLFPPHDSLSSSSMSRFPSNISTNTMTMHNSRMLPNNEVIDSERTPSDSDLTFAGKFKSSSGNTGLATIPETTSHLLLKKSFSDSKDSSDVVVVESRSCSPFTTAQMGPDDSCSSSSRATMLVEPINSNANSNQELAIEQKSMQPQRLQQLSIGQQEQALSCNSAPAGVSVPTSSSLLPGNQQQQQQPGAAPVVVAAPPGPKKRGRKKGSRGYDAVIAQTHAFLNAFERPRLFLGSKKVKTTKELLADIQNRKLGSSAASSPTLAVSRPSASPSTCSEASFQSDLTNTRASLLNPSPDLLGGTSVNRRPSDIDEIDSTTDSNEVGSALARPQPSTNIQKVDDDNDENKSRKAAALSSVDEYLTKLMKCLPPIDYSKRESIDPDVVCTCTIRIAEPVVTVTVSPKKEEEEEQQDGEKTSKMLEAAKDDAVHRDLSALAPEAASSESSSLTVVNVPVVVPVPPPPPPLPPPPPQAQPVKTSPKKPVKSIFDLDYDEDNDPLQSFVAAAKLRISEQAAVKEPDDRTRDRDADDHGDISDNFIAVNSVGKSNHPSNSNSVDVTVTSNRASAFQQPTISIPNGGGFFDSSTVPEVAPLNFLQYEAVEDPDCVAKHRYEVKTSCITEYHVNTLHNRFMPSVNGNWSAPVPLTIDHRKRIRRYLSKTNRSRTTANNTTEGGTGSNQVKHETGSTLLSNTEFVTLIRASVDDSSDDEKLYERVVPHYDHIIMDRIPKDFSFVKFAKNYMKQKRRWFKGEADGNGNGNRDATKATGESSNKTSTDEVRKAKKRKRSRTMSAKDGSGKSDENDDESRSERKRKHQRRKKQRKLRVSNLDTSTYVDTNLSRIEKKDVDGNGDGEGDGVGDDVGSGNSRSDIVSSATRMKPNTFSDTDKPTSVLHNFPEFHSILQDETIIDAASLTTTTTTLEKSLAVERECNQHGVAAIASMPKDQANVAAGPEEIGSSRAADGGNKDKDVVDVTLIESSSNSDSYCSNIVNNSSSDKAKDLQPLSSVATSFAIENDGSISHDSYGSGYGEQANRNPEQRAVGDNIENIEGGGVADDEADEDVEYDMYGDADEDCDEDDHNNDEEHEVVTHDMTSSTSTTSQQHIVLTIKKKIPKLATSHINSDGNVVGKQQSPARMWTYSKEDEDQLSIITSSNPTSIKIRRKNNIDRSKHQHRTGSLDYGQQSQRSDYRNSDENNYTDILDNNNIKNGRDSTPSHGDDNSTDVIKASIISNDGDYAASTMAVPQSFQVDHETIAEAADNHVMRMKETEHIDPVQRDHIDLTSIDQSSAKSTTDQLPIDVSMQSDREPINYDQLNGQPYDNNLADSIHGEHDDDVDVKSVSENNGLLESFNRISDENIIGLRANPPSTTTPLSDTDEVKSLDLETVCVEEFKEWHEVLLVPSYNDELLTILPYVVID